MSKTLFLVAVLATTGAQAFLVPSLTTTYDELSDCLKSMGACFNSSNGRYMEAYGHSECEAGSEYTWFEEFSDAETFNLATVSKMEDIEQSELPGIFMVRLSEESRASEELRVKLSKEIGTDLYDYIRCENGAEYYTFLGTIEQAQKANSAKETTHMIAVPDTLKVSPTLKHNGTDFSTSSLRFRVAPTGISKADIANDLTIRLTQFEASASSPGNLAELKASIDGDFITLQGFEKMDSVRINHMSQENEVSYMEVVPEFMNPFNLDSSLVVHTGKAFTNDEIIGKDVTQLSPYWKAGIDGTGQIVGVSDTGLDAKSCFFRDPNVEMTHKLGDVVTYDNHRKIHQYNAFAGTNDRTRRGHGTHVVGTILGNDINDGQDEANGVAYNAKVAFGDIGEYSGSRVRLKIPSDLGEGLFKVAHEAGAYIHSNSWGANWNSYSTEARDVDKYAYENQDFLILFAIGNSGPYKKSCGTPGLAKNNIAVGASANTRRAASCPAAQTCHDNMAYFSSVGPTYDNRITPDIVAPGHPLLSAESSATDTETCETANLSGTSMATPLVAGNAALVRQYLVEGYYPSGEKNEKDGFTPMAALIKAILINGAKYLKGKQTSTKDLPDEEPSVFQGFGRILLNRNLYIKGETQVTKLFLDGDFKNMPEFKKAGQKKEYKFRILPGATEDLRATLVYADYPATLTATKSLVNDLDIRVEVFDKNKNKVEKTVYPNGLDTKDDTNNVEQVVLKQKDNVDLFLNGGDFIVVVEAAAIPQGDGQPYALAVSGDIEKWSSNTVAPTDVTVPPTSAAQGTFQYAAFTFITFIVVSFGFTL